MKNLICLIKMIVIADSNIFISALIAPNGVISSILTERKSIQFVVPNFLIWEVQEHFDTIIKATKKTKKQINKEFQQLLEDIIIFDTDKITKKNFTQAYKITKDIDEDDTFFIALHLQIKHKIWSGDETLKNGLTSKGYGHFFISTAELKAKIYKKKK